MLQVHKKSDKFCLTTGHKGYKVTFFKSEQVKGNMTTRNLVNIDNKLAQASYTMSLAEQRLVFILLSKVKPTEYLVPMTEEDLQQATVEEMQKVKAKKVAYGDVINATDLHTVSVREYAEFCGIRADNARQDLLDVSDTLFNRYIHIKKEDGGFAKFRWVGGVYYDKTEDTVSLRWSVDILPYITKLTQYFTKLRLKDLLGLHSTYSWKLYIILKSHRGENNFKKDVTISVEDLVAELDVPESCKEFKVLNSKILQKATNELKKTALPDLKMGFNKKGKRVESVSWLGVPPTKYMEIV